MLDDFLTRLVDVVTAAIAIEEAHQARFLVVVLLDLARICRRLVDSRLSSSPLTIFNCLLNNIPSSIAPRRHVTLSILSFLNIILCKTTRVTYYLNLVCLSVWMNRLMRLPVTIYWEWRMPSRWVLLTLEVPLPCIIEYYSSCLLFRSIFHVLILWTQYFFINCLCFNPSAAAATTIVDLFNPFARVLFSCAAAHPAKL